ncbi:murein hydrolase activator EnvC family protein [Pseudahrensia aquimaris]|uniref:Murein hydrolase activator EnvC family protein n=1 Tax=Pseudahrensia aquimaris TaxID=744461 RepID=A0ABW3FIA3_9HYPH
MIRPTAILTAFACVAFSPATHATAQQAQVKLEDRISPDEEKEASKAELEALRESLEQVTERQRRLREEIDRLDKDKGAINRALIETANRSQQLDAGIAEQEKKLAQLDGSRQTLRKSLARKRGLLSEVLASLQRMGKNPPPAILVSPEDAVGSVRSAILLGAVVPEVRAETTTLLAELRTLAEIGRQIENERQLLATDLNKLAEDETRLSLLLEERDAQTIQSRQQLEAEQVLARELAQKATSLEELIKQIETQITSANQAAEAARASDRNRAQAEAERLKAAREALARGETAETLERRDRLAKLDPRFADNSRIAPAMAFRAAKGLLPKPVSGEQTHEFGAKSTAGVVLPNVGYATRPNARVRSPSDGWVVYAGPFRSYGNILILNAGDSYRYILSGMDSLNVRVGQFVLAGEPVGRMGLTQVASATALDLSSTQPVLYVELRQGGKPIDPTPWWARENEKGTDDDT